MTTETDAVLIRYWPDEDDLFHDHTREATLHFDAMVPNGEGEYSGALTITVLMNDDHAGTIVTERLTFGDDLRHYTIPFFLPEGGVDPVFRLIETTAAVEVLNLQVITPTAAVAYESADEYRVAVSG